MPQIWEALLVSLVSNLALAAAKSAYHKALHRKTDGKLEEILDILKPEGKIR